MPTPLHVRERIRRRRRKHLGLHDTLELPVTEPMPDLLAMSAFLLVAMALVAAAIWG